MPAFYLKPEQAGGNDANDGDSSLEPWATWGRAAQRHWLPGDRLIVAGDYPGIPATVELKGGGDPANPVLIGEAGAPATLSFSAALANSPKFVVCGVGFVVDSLSVTQEAKGNSPGDRMVVAQLSQDGNHSPSDVLFRRIRAWKGYELFKASGVVQRIRFVAFEGWDARIGAGIAGAADDCSFEEGLLRDFADDGIQTKGGCRNPRVLRCTIVMGAGSDSGIVLGGSSAINDGIDPAWWRDDGYESSHALSCSNLVILAAGGADDYPALIRFAGAKHARSANDTLVQLDAFQDGYATAFQVSRGGGSGWADGNPYAGDVTIENAVVVGVDQLITVNNGHLPLGSNALRNLTLHGVYDNLADEGYDGGAKGTWALGARAVRDPRLLATDLAGAWEDLDVRPEPGSPERGAAAPVVHTWFGGATERVDRDMRGVRRGATAWDRGAFDETAYRRQRRRKQAQARRRRAA